MTGDSDFKKIFENGNLTLIILLESVFLSCKIKKYNKYDWKQERTFVVTELNLYTLKGKSNLINSSYCFTELRRKIAIQLLAGLTVSKNPKSQELVIHVLGESDLRMKSDK